MNNFWEFLGQLLHPASIVQYGGLYLLLFVIFAETGLFFGFFLPGDSLLFVAGLFCAISEESIKRHQNPVFDVSVLTLLLGCMIAAILGNFVGYFFGLRASNYLNHKKDSLLFKRKYIDMAREFYAARGGLAIVMGRFIPIIRTFVPIFAGMVSMQFRKFLIFNILGGAFWVSALVLAGYFLGKRFPSLADHIEWIVLSLIAISIIPVITTFLKKNKSAHYVW